MSISVLESMPLRTCRVNEFTFNSCLKRELSGNKKALRRGRLLDHSQIFDVFPVRGKDRSIDSLPVFVVAYPHFRIPFPYLAMRASFWIDLYRCSLAFDCA